MFLTLHLYSSESKAVGFVFAVSYEENAHKGAVSVAHPQGSIAHPAALRAPGTCSSFFHIDCIEWTWAEGWNSARGQSNEGCVSVIQGLLLWGFALPGAALPSSDARTRGVLFILSPTDQHLHDTLVQLRERPPGLVHLCQPGQLRSYLDKPETANPSPSPAGSQVFWAIPWAEGPSLAGEGWARDQIKNCLGFVFNSLFQFHVEKSRFVLFCFFFSWLHETASWSFRMWLCSPVACKRLWNEYALRCVTKIIFYLWLYLPLKMWGRASKCMLCYFSSPFGTNRNKAFDRQIYMSCSS